MKEFTYFKNFNWTKACPLLLPARMVYSFLIYKNAFGNGANKAELRTRLPFHHKTTNDGLARLEEHGLVRTVDDCYHPNQLSGNQLDWVLWKNYSEIDKPKHWRDKAWHHAVYFPTKACPLTPQSLTIYCLCLDYDRRDELVIRAGLSTLTKINERTVRRNLELLQRYDLFDMYEAGAGKYDIIPKVLTAEQEEWFVKRQNVKPKPSWQKWLMQLRTPYRDLARVKRVVSLLREYYHKDTRLNVYNGEPIVPLDDMVRDELYQALQDWDEKNYRSVVPLLIRKLHKRLARHKLQERYGFPCIEIGLANLQKDELNPKELAEVAAHVDQWSKPHPNEELFER